MNKVWGVTAQLVMCLQKREAEDAEDDAILGSGTGRGSELLALGPGPVYASFKRTSPA